MDKLEIGYSITTDPEYLNKQNYITPELSRKIERYHQMALDGKESSIKKLKNAIKKYPKNPQLKNYLSVLYQQLGKVDKIYEVNRWLIKEHPNYLFGKLNLANEYHSKEEYDKMPDVLGPAMELSALYPERDTFHIQEVLAFLNTTILYYTGIGNIEQAEIRHEIMQGLAPNSSATQVAMKHIRIAIMKAAHKRHTEEQKNKISVVTKEQEITTVYQAARFHHQEIEWLYNKGLYIEEEKIDNLLSLPRNTLIQDLELVLQDSINRYRYFEQWVEQEGWDEEKMNFILHALYLLAEIQVIDDTDTTESIDSIFNVLSQSKDYLEFYLGDFLTEIMWEVVYKVGANNLEACKQFMFKPAIYTYARTIITSMVEQVALHQPDRRAEVITWYTDVIQFFLGSNIEDNVIDSDTIALMICSIINIEGKELLSDVEKLFNKGLVSTGICGDWDEVSKAIVKRNTYDKKSKILTIKERYKNVTSTWAGYNEDWAGPNEDDSDMDDESIWDPTYEDYLESKIMPPISNPKIGRNEPCPCGSGKKYKKCCLNN